MTHECTNEGKISAMATDIEYLKGNDQKIEKTLDKLEGKIDKILWFILGQCVAVIYLIIGGIGG